MPQVMGSNGDASLSSPHIDTSAMTSPSLLMVCHGALNELLIGWLGSRPRKS